MPSRARRLSPVTTKNSPQRPVSGASRLSSLARRESTTDIFQARATMSTMIAAKK
jgi:hypothetical protein